MSTPIIPAPAVVLASDFPTAADRPAGNYNSKAIAWAGSENAMATSVKALADNAENNAIAAEEQAVIADAKATEAQAWAESVGEPGGTGTKSSKAWSDKSQAWAESTTPPEIGAKSAKSHAADADIAEQSAWAAAAAAGTSAGLPSPLIPGRMLGAISDSAVGWVDGSPPLIATPTNLSPADETVDVVAVNFTGSPFYSLYGKAQKSRQARISLSPVFATTLWDSGEVIGASVTVSGPELDGLIPISTTAYWQIRYRDIDNAWSEWSQPTSFTTAAQYIPTVIGQPWGGGFYAGKIKVGVDTYLLITGPKSSEITLQWKTTNDSSPGTSSTSDGLSNSNAMNNSAHPAAKHCRDYRGGGFDDWSLPAKSEREIEYRAFKPDATANQTSYGANPDSVPTRGNYTAGDPPQTSLAEFKTGGAEAFTAGYYWTSTETSATYAWTQNFSNGLQYTSLKDASFVVRPVRRLKI